MGMGAPDMRANHALTATVVQWLGVFLGETNHSAGCVSVLGDPALFFWVTHNCDPEPVQETSSLSLVRIVQT